MQSPLDLNRLASRIETLERHVQSPARTSTHGWMPGDDLEFRRGLHDEYIRDTRGRLPSSQTVRAAANGEGEVTVEAYRNAIQVCLRLESLISRNRLTSPQRMMHDMARGRLPGFRR